jgi:alpha-glucosidase
VGDLAGIRARLPYLRWLGVDGVWLSPFYVSPMADFGYDVADHCDVDPLFGTLADFDALAAEARRLGLRLILDYIPNHTSDRHRWFREHPEYYIWRDAPNNWVSVFGGSAWAPRDGRFYYHAYLPQQPDLDWRNPAVCEAMLGVLRFWCERGADGFRIDALRQVVKDAQWRDNPLNPDWDGRDEYASLIPTFTTDRPEVQEIVRAFRACRSSGSSPTTARGSTCRRTSTCCRRRGTRPRSRRWWSATRRRCRRARGRTGCSPTTTARASPRASAGPRRRRCCC